MELAGAIVGAEAVVATAMLALVGVLRLAESVAGTPGVLVMFVTAGWGVPFCGVGVPAIGLGVPVVTTPPAATVCATDVCLANSAIISNGFSADGNGETNSPVAIWVGVAAGACDSDF